MQTHKNRGNHLSARRIFILSVTGGIFLLYLFALPHPLFNDPVSWVLEARDGTLLGAKIAADGQWRFPYNPQVPEKFEQSVLCFEDQRFYRHIGVDFLALGRAFRQNLRQGKIVSGGSTISMQVIRLARKGKPRTLFQKAIEIVMATRLEIRYTKKQILALYASNAPFGGNVVGLETAAWRYYQKAPAQLSWGESATLAVLPNSPALIHPGRNRNALKAKRDRLLLKMKTKGILDEGTYSLAIEEPLPDKPYPLPREAPHLLERAASNQLKVSPGQRTKIKSTLDPVLQRRVSALAFRKSRLLKNNQIHNLAVIVIDIPANEVVAYIGNAENTGMEHGEYVDIVTASRSTGSILKPFLFARMMNEGQLLPGNLIPDVPTYLGDYRPRNFLDTYDGAVPAANALSRSLNVPFVKMLKTYGVEKFHYDLKNLGLTSLHSPPLHYGLSLILGGAEASLWDLSAIYAGMARRLNGFYPQNGWYDPTDFQKPAYLTEQAGQEKTEQKLEKETPLLRADAIWFTFEAMQELERPTAQGEWERFESSARVAWKTGTSFGFRDAWAIGITPQHVVGVWAGNADGEGRPGLVGVYAAAPLLFEVMELLPRGDWFDPPYDAMERTVVCKKSGYLAQDICEKDTVWGPGNSIRTQVCPYHRLVHLNKDGTYQVNRGCASADEIRSVSWFLLPSLQAHYFLPRHPDYQILPPFDPNCLHGQNGLSAMELIYPENPTRIYIPVELDGSRGKAVFRVAHRDPETVIYWHIDNEYIEKTEGFHNLEVSPSPGKHRLTLVDENGSRLEEDFEIIIRQ